MELVVKTPRREFCSMNITPAGYFILTHANRKCNAISRSITSFFKMSVSMSLRGGYDEAIPDNTKVLRFLRGVYAELVPVLGMTFSASCDTSIITNNQEVLS
jgi:hypothetical protein